MERRLVLKLQKYTIPSSAVKLIKNTKMVFMVGITGAGKDSVRHGLLDTGNYHHIISHTTRAKRKNHGVLEKDGVEYHFIDFDTAENMIDAGDFVEAKVFSTNIYGTSVAEIQIAHDEQKIAISDIEVQGVAEYRAVANNVMPIFILPPDFETWQKRLRNRYEGKVDLIDLNNRMKTALEELREAIRKEYFEFVINGDLGKTIEIADEIAHGHFSNKKNKQAKLIAEKLIFDIDNHLKS